MNLSDDEDLCLSPEAALALSEFLAENQKNTESSPSEDWQLSQFWYNSETTQKLADEVISQSSDSSRIVCISCPTLHLKLLELNIPSTLLEYDTRFSCYETFIKYDYNSPLELPADIENQFDIIIVDPPFLSEECLRKTSQTVKWLSNSNESTKIMLCTGRVQEELALELLCVKQCKKFQPKHERQLSNEFGCFVNFEPLVLDE